MTDTPNGGSVATHKLLIVDDEPKIGRTLSDYFLLHGYEVRVIILSAVDHEEVVKGALQLGADFYVTKPVRLEELERYVRGYIPARRLP